MSLLYTPYRFAFLFVVMLTLWSGRVLGQRDGSLDTTFSAQTLEVSGSAIQPDGKILLGHVISLTEAKIVRLNADGTPDPSFNEGYVTSPNYPNYATAIVQILIQSDGKIVVAGHFYTFNGTRRINMARLLPDGTLDYTYDANLREDVYFVNALALLPDDKILAGVNEFDLVTNRPYCLWRINTDGSRDTSFYSGYGLNANVNSIYVQQDGKILVAGLFDSFRGVWRRYFARLHADGTLDSAYNPASNFEAWGAYFALEPDGKVVAGGTFRSFNGIPTGSLIRLNEDGTLDSTYRFSQPSLGNAYPLAVQKDGKTIIGCVSRTSPVIQLARVARNGDLDSTFLISSFPGTLESLSIQSNWKIILGGDFTTFNGRPVQNIVRLNNTDTARYLPLAQSSTDTLDMDSTIVYRSSVASFQVQNKGNDWLKLSQFASSNPIFTTDAGADSIAPGDSLRITVRFSPQATGLQTGTLISLTNDSTHPRVAVYLRGTGLPLPPPNVTLSTNLLEFDSVSVGRSRSMPLTLYNHGSSPIRISDVTSSYPDFAVTRTTDSIAGGDSTEITIRFAPTYVGNQIGTVAIFCNADTMAVTVSGTGREPSLGRLACAIDSLWLPSTSLGGTSTASFYLRNIGQRDITGVITSSSNPSFTLNPSIITPLLADDSILIRVDFQPTTAGPQTSLVMMYADGRAPLMLVLLSSTITALDADLEAHILSPNPARPGQTLHIAGAGSPLRLTDMQGRLMSTLSEQEPGAYTLPTVLAPGYYLLTSGRGQRYRLCVAPQ